MSTKTLKTSIQNKIDTASMWDKSTFTSLEGEMFVYRVEGEYTCPRLKFGNGSDVVEVLPFTGGATSVADSPVKTPAQVGTLKYNGSSQSPTWSNYNAAVLDIGGTLSESIPGTYTATFTPKSGYCWEDTLTKEQRSVSWVITNADATITFVDSNNNPVNLTSVELTEVGTAQGFDFEVTGGTVSVQSSNINYVVASINGFGLWLTPGEENGTATVTLTVTPNQYYNGTTKTITVTNKVAVSSNLDNVSWEKISEISANGNANTFWSIGDTKLITLNGSIGSKLTLTNFETRVFILDFYHHGTTGINFGAFKTADNNTFIYLADSLFLSGSTSDLNVALKFSMNYGASNSNYGGWKQCYLRSRILGSTETQGQDATSAAITSPVSNSLMAALPSDLRSVLKPMTVYSDNVGNNTAFQSNISATVDYLPLLSVYELRGEAKDSNPYEANFQVQYTYFSSGNTAAMYKYPHNNTSLARTTNWWSRSTDADSSYNFCTGWGSANAASMSLGLSPVFTV